MDETNRPDRESLPFAILGAFDAAVLSALAWAAVTVLTKYQIGYMAVGVGALVGVSVRYFGQGRGAVYRALSVAFALAGCVFGNYLSQVGFYLAESGEGLLEVVLSLRPAQAPQILAESFSPLDLLFYGLAVFQAWKYAAPPETTLEIDASAEDGSAANPGTGSPGYRAGLFAYPPRKALAASLAFLGILALPVYVATHSAGTARGVYDSGARKYEGALDWNEPHGTWKYWYESGKLLAELEFRRGLPDGQSVHYLEDGSVSERKTWKAGFLHGPCEQYYPDGTPRTRGSYEYDRKTGIWEEYHPNGKLGASGPMLLDLQHGAWEIRSASGALTGRAVYDMGSPAGIWESYSGDGTLELRREFADGEARILYQRDDGRETVVDGKGRYVQRYENGRIAVEGAVEGGRKAGVWRDWYRSGRLWREYEYADGREYLRGYYLENGDRAVRDGAGILETEEEGGGRIEAVYVDGLLEGEVRTFYPDGTLMILATYFRGRPEGPQKTYAPDGTLLTEGESRDGLQTGPWTWYGEDGSLSSRVEFSFGKKQGVQSFFEDGILVKEEVYRDGVCVETRLKR